MRGPASEFRDHLARDESLVATGSGTLIDGTGREDVSLGATDRRLISLTDDDGFLDLRYDAIHSIRSRSKEQFTVRGIAARGGVAMGVLLTVTAFLGVIVLTWNPVASVLAIASVAGILSAERGRRTGFASGRTVLDRIIDRVVDGLGRHRLQRPKPVATYVDEDEERILARALGAVLAFVALAAVTQSVVVVTLVFLILGGITLGWRSLRYLQRLNAKGESRRKERELRLGLADGRTVELRIDPDEHIDRELSRLVSTGADSSKAPRANEPSTQ